MQGMGCGHECGEYSTQRPGKKVVFPEARVTGSQGELWELNPGPLSE